MPSIIIPLSRCDRWQLVARQIGKIQTAKAHTHTRIVCMAEWKERQLIGRSDDHFAKEEYLNVSKVKRRRGEN